MGIEYGGGPTRREVTGTLPQLPRVGIWEHVLPENRLLISDGFCRLAGVDPGYGRSNPLFWSERVHEDDIVSMRAAYDAFLAGEGEEFETRYRVRHDDGRWISILARARWEWHDGAGGGLVRGYVMDISFTDRLRLQSEVIERISEGVLLVSRDGVIRFVNPVFEATLGYPHGEMIGQHARILSFRTAEAFDGLVQTVFEATQDGSSAVIDLEGRRRDGLLLPMQGRFSALKFEGVPHVVGLFNDISARKQSEREMLQMATQVQQRVGGDLHEGLGQQLSGIAMMLQAMREDSAAINSPALRAQLDEVVKQLNGAVQRTRVLARGLSPVRPSAQGITEGFEELVNNVLDVYGLRVRLEMDLPDDLSVDENAVMNLFHIAREAIENAARHAEARDIRVHLHLAGPDLELCVEDDGVGFDPARSGAGGMGLRMMRFRAEMAHGYLSIESHPGHGARLRCRCPARVQASPT